MSKTGTTKRIYEKTIKTTRVKSNSSGAHCNVITMTYDVSILNSRTLRLRFGQSEVALTEKMNNETQTRLYRVILAERREFGTVLSRSIPTMLQTKKTGNKLRVGLTLNTTW